MSESKDEKKMLTRTTLGVLGGGQLGRMMAWAAHRLGVRLVALDKPGRASPAGEAAVRCEFTLTSLQLNARKSYYIRKLYL